MGTQRHFHTRRIALAVAVFSGACLCCCLALAETVGDSWPRRTIALAGVSTHGRPPVVTALCIRPGGRFLAAAGDDHLIYIWDLVDDAVVQRLEGHEDWVHTVAYSPDGRVLATAGTDQRLIFWDADSGKQLCAFGDSSNALTRVAWSRAGTEVVVTGFACAVRIYDTSQRRLLRELQAPCTDMRAVAFSIDDRLIAAGGRNGLVRVWRMDHSEPLFEYKAHRQRIRELLFSPDGKQIVSCGEDRRIHVWSLKHGRGKDLPPRPTKIFSMTFFGPHHLAYGGSDNLVRLWDLSTATEIGRLTGHQGSVAALDCDGELLVSGGYDTSIHVWTIKDRVAKSPGGRRALQ